MCRSIKLLFNFEPPVSSGEIHAASRKLLDALQTGAPAKNREAEASKSKLRAALQFHKVN